MKHVGVEHPAKVPASAVQHWEGSGWERTDPPPRRTYRTPTQVTAEQARGDAALQILDAPPLPQNDAPADPPAGKKPPTQKAPSRRKED